MSYFLIFILFIWLLIIQNRLGNYKTTIDNLTKEIDKLLKKIETTNLKIKILQEDQTKIKENQENTQIHLEEAASTIQNESVVNIVEEEQNTQTEQDIVVQEEIEQVSYASKNEEKIQNTDEVINYEYIPDLDNQDIEQYRSKYTFNSPKVKKENDFENFFLGNAFTIVGALALIIGIGFFMTIIYTAVTPLMKTILGFIFGLCLIAISNHLGKSDNLKKYSEVLMGTGFSALFITTLCSAVLFKTFSPTACIFIAGIILSVAYIVADKQKTLSMIAISLIGGYLNIFFVDNININMTFGYLIFLNLLSVIYTFRNPDKEIINVINLVVTLLFIFIQTDTKEGLSFIFPVILWLVYLIFDLVKNLQNKDTDEGNILNWVNLGVLSFFSLIIFKENKLAIGITLISMAMVYNLILAYLITKSSEKFKPYLYSMLVTILLSIYFLLDGTSRIMAWSFFGLLIAFVVKKLDREYLSNWILVFFAPAIINIFFIDDVFFIEKEYVILWNNRLLAFLYPILGTCSSYFLLKDMKYSSAQKTSDILKFVSITLIYLWLFLELNNYIYSLQNLEGTMKIVPSVIVGFIYSLQMKKFAMTNKLYIFEIAANLIGCVSLVALLIAGWNYKPVNAFVPMFNTRVLAFTTAIGASICYARWTKEESFKYLATILGFILITCECFDFIDKYYALEINYIVSIAWLIYSFAITTVGINANKSYLKNVGIITSILTVIRILFYDMSNVDILYKLIIFMLLGAILMIISYMYNKNKK